jgi:hypothetical protein
VYFILGRARPCLLAVLHQRAGNDKSELAGQRVNYDR